MDRVPARLADSQPTDAALANDLLSPLRSRGGIWGVPSRQDPYPVPDGGAAYHQR